MALSFSVFRGYCRLYYGTKSKEEFTMKNVIKFGLVGLAGYFVGFYEMKYKVTKFIAKNALEKLGEKDPKEEGEKEES